MSCWCARCTDLKLSATGVHSGKAQEQSITQGDGLDRCTSNIVDVCGRLGKRVILQLHDHR